MVDVTIKRSKVLKRAGSKPKSVTSRRVTKANGEKITVYTIDADAPTFSEDFLYVFRKSVQAARKENKRLLGSFRGV